MSKVEAIEILEIFSPPLNEIFEWPSVPQPAEMIARNDLHPKPFQLLEYQWSEGEVDKQTSSDPTRRF